MATDTSVLVGVAQIQGFAHAVVAGAVEFDAGRYHTLQRIGQLRARGIEDGEVIEAGAAGRRRLAARALPGVEADVVVVAAGGDERGLVAVALDQLEAQHVAIERQRAVDVGDLEVYVADAHAVGDGVGGGVVGKRLQAGISHGWHRMLELAWAA